MTITAVAIKPESSGSVQLSKRVMSSFFLLNWLMDNLSDHLLIRVVTLL